MKVNVTVRFHHVLTEHGFVDDDRRVTINIGCPTPGQWAVDNDPVGMILDSAVGELRNQRRIPAYYHHASRAAATYVPPVAA